MGHDGTIDPTWVQLSELRGLNELANGGIVVIECTAQSIRISGLPLGSLDFH